MKRGILACVLVAMLALVCAPTFAASQKDPLTAGLMSFCVPGLGQFYNGQVGKGVLFLVGVGAGYGVMLVGASQTKTTDLGYGYTVEDPDPNKAMMYGGLGLILVCEIW